MYCTKYKLLCCEIEKKIRGRKKILILINTKVDRYIYLRYSFVVFVNNEIIQAYIYNKYI